MKINVTVSKASDGRQDYIQLMSDDMISVNIVLVADDVVMQDARPRKPQASEAERVLDAALDKAAGIPKRSTRKTT